MEELLRSFGEEHLVQKNVGDGGPGGSDELVVGQNELVSQNKLVVSQNELVNQMSWW